MKTKKYLLIIALVLSVFSLNAQITGYKITMLLTDTNKVTIYAKPQGSGSVKWLQNSITLAVPTSSAWGSITASDYTAKFNETLFAKATQQAIVHTDVSNTPSGYSYITFWASTDPEAQSTQLINGTRYEVCTVTTKTKINVPIRLINLVDNGGVCLDGITVIGDNSIQHYVSNGIGNTLFYSSLDETITVNKTGYAGSWSTTGSTNEWAWVEINVPSADLDVKIDVSNKTPKVNETVTYTITTKNNGTNNAPNTLTNIKLPSSLQFVSSDAASTNTTYNATTGLWSIGTLNNGSSLVLKIVCKVVKVATINVTATTESDLADMDLTNNTNSVTITVANQAPDVTGDGITTTQNDPITSTVTGTDPDGDALTYTVTTPPTHGTVVIDPKTGEYTYTPNKDYTGTDSFTVTVSDGNGGTDSVVIPVTVLATPDLKKYSLQPEFQNDGTYNITYVIVINNDRQTQISSVQVEDNLDNVFAGTGCTYSVKNITASGHLTANTLFNGSTIIKTLAENQIMAAGAKDSITILVNVDTKGQSSVITVRNKAVFSCDIDGNNFSDDTNTASTDIPVVSIFIPDGFTPNGDGYNDYFTVIHPSNTTIDLQIVNRWGNVVYASKEYKNDWDGKGTGNFLGKELPNGTYYCTYKVINSSGNIDAKGVKCLMLRRN